MRSMVLHEHSKAMYRRQRRLNMLNEAWLWNQLDEPSELNGCKRRCQNIRWSRRIVKVHISPSLLSCLRGDAHGPMSQQPQSRGLPSLNGWHPAAPPQQQCGEGRAKAR